MIESSDSCGHAGKAILLYSLLNPYPTLVSLGILGLSCGFPEGPSQNAPGSRPPTGSSQVMVLGGGIRGITISYQPPVSRNAKKCHFEAMPRAKSELQPVWLAENSADRHSHRPFSQVPQTLTGARYMYTTYSRAFAGVSTHVQDTIGLI